ncbi:phosphoribosyltransferase [Agromyces sp. LHK192]|uniref:phosphoribosyltransferase n=1 Tax=Agromyces sp. LHK192 TaxID=2498704 RepID=UPI00196AF44B|nr:phosphoribosyltransferase family protein [Agromyces sp. LHK192]
MERFADRHDAGRRLGDALRKHRTPGPPAGTSVAPSDALPADDPVVLALPRGGVPVAVEVARILGVRWDVLVVRKLGLPSSPEVAMGAVGEGGTVVWNADVRRLASDDVVDRVEVRERAEVANRVARFRDLMPRADLAGRTAIIVDDGVATGATARAACRIARELGAARVVLAVPVGPGEVLTALRRDADDVVCVRVPPQFMAVGQHYVDFRQVTDAEVSALLEAEASGRR